MTVVDVTAYFSSFILPHLVHSFVVLGIIFEAIGNKSFLDFNRFLSYNNNTRSNQSVSFSSSSAK